MRLFILLSLLFVMIGANAQSITKTSTAVSISYPLEDYEKAVKSSSSMIPSKKGRAWSVNTDKWETTFSANVYSLRKNGIEIYSSTTIAAIRAKYLSELLGIPMSKINS